MIEVKKAKTHMDRRSVKELLVRRGFEVLAERMITNGTGRRIDLRTGQIVNVFDSGTVVVQGKNTEEVKRLFDGSPDTNSTSVRIAIGGNFKIRSTATKNGGTILDIAEID